MQDTAKQLGKAEKEKASLQARAEAVERLVEEVRVCARERERERER